MKRALFLMVLSLLMLCPWPAPADELPLPMAHWDFNDPNDLGRDVSGNGFRLEIPIPGTAVPGRESGAIKFPWYVPGTNYGSTPLGPYASTSGATYLEGTGLTLDALVWVGGDNMLYLMDYTQHQANGETYYFTANGSGVKFQIHPKGTRAEKMLEYDTTDHVGRWSQWTGVFDKQAGSLSVYLDGQLVKTETQSMDNGEDYPPFMYVSGSWHGTVGGIYDYVRIYDTPLSGQQVAGLVETPRSGPRTWAVLVGSRAPSQPDGTDEVIRGDLSMRDMETKLLEWIPAERIATRELGWTSDSSTDLYGELAATLNGFEDAGLAEGDTLVFYYAGHGSGSIDTGEDESMDYARGTALSDDQLRTLFASNPGLAGVNKVVFLDTCHGGGFWYSDGDGDSDLEDLPLTAVFAAAGEHGQTVFRYEDGRGVFTETLVELLEPGITLSELEQALADAHLGELHDGWLADFGSGSVEWGPSAAYSSDLDTTDPVLGTVPEPATLGLLAAAVLLTTRRRRARR